MVEDVNIAHIEDSVGNIGNKQICVETGNDSQTAHRMWAGKDGAGNTYKFLGKGKPAYIQNLNVSDFTTAGLLRTDASGDITGDVNTLGELNTALGTDIDESTDERDPSAHALGGAAHMAATLAQLNALVSDATLDDASDTRDPSAHALGGAAHTAATLAQLNALVSDATLDNSVDTRPPSAHALGSASHTASTLATINTKISDADLPHNISGSSEIGDAFEIVQGDIVDSTDSFAVQNRDATLIKSGENIEASVGGNYVAISPDFLFLVSGTDVMYQIDRRSGKVLNSSSGSQNRAMCYHNGLVILPSSGSNTVREYEAVDVSQYKNIVATGLSGNVYQVRHRTTDNKLYVLNDAGVVSTLERGASDYTYVSSVFTIDSKSTSFCFDDTDDQYLYAVVPDDTQSRVIKYDITGSFQGQSSTFNMTGSLSNGSDIAIQGEHIAATYLGKVDLYDKTDVTSRLFSGSSTLDDGPRVLDQNHIYAISQDAVNLHMYSAQLPALTVGSPACEDSRGGGGVRSADGVLNDDGTLYEVLKSEEVLNDKHAVETWNNLGARKAVTTKGIVNSVAALTGYTATTDSSSDSDILRIESGNLDVLLRNYDVERMSVFDVEIIASALDGSADGAQSVWHGKAVLFSENPAVLTMDNNFTQITNGESIFTTEPTFIWDTVNDVLEITVTHTGLPASIFNVSWQAHIRGQIIDNCAQYNTA